MSEPVSLDAARAAREQPAAEFVRADQWGRPLFQFAANYEVEGRRWEVRFWAFDFDHAERAIAAMGGRLGDLGQVMEEGAW